MAAGLAAVAAGLYLGQGRETRILDEGERRRLGGSFATLADGITAYEDTGPVDRPAVVLLHGATVAGFDWERQEDPLARAGLRVIRYDMLGRGRSDRPAVTYDRALYERQLLGLLDHLRLRSPVHLVGHSFGGATAVRFAARHSNRVERLALIAPMVNGVASRTPFVIAGLPGIGPFLMRVAVGPALSRRFRGQLECCPADAKRLERRFREQLAWTGYEQAVHSMFTSDAIGDYRDDYRAVGEKGRPVLVLRGTKDADITAADIDEALDLLGPSARLLSLDGAGHSPNFEVPGLVNTALTGFLTGG
ncbi:MAG TPA: alpha/beta hydrolase [Polyangia bacterium]|nr:alpha/beta hydrolase [Polyangia bacterium]